MVWQPHYSRNTALNMHTSDFHVAKIQKVPSLSSSYLVCEQHLTEADHSFLETLLCQSLGYSTLWLLLWLPSLLKEAFSVFFLALALPTPLGLS